MEKVLNKLIELGYVQTQIDGIYINYFDADGEEMASEIFSPESCAGDFLTVQRALFDERGKRDYKIIIENNQLGIFFIFTAIVYKGDTSRQSFLDAFKIVTGCE